MPNYATYLPYMQKLLDNSANFFRNFIQVEALSDFFIPEDILKCHGANIPQLDHINIPDTDLRIHITYTYELTE